MPNAGVNEDADAEAGIDLRKGEEWPKSVYKKLGGGDERNGFDRFGDTEFVGKEREKESDDQMCDNIHQQARQGIGDAIQRADGEKENGERLLATDMVMLVL